MSSAYLQCMEDRCRQTYPLDSADHQCKACGGLLDVRYEFAPVKPEALRRTWEERRSGSTVLDQSGVWRFRELLPFVPAGKDVVSLSEGRTPLVEVTRTREVGGRRAAER